MSLALSLFVGEPRQALERAHAARGRASRVELRLDRAPRLDFAALVRAMPLPVVAACPRRAEGGFFGGSGAEREARLLAAAEGGADFLDLPLGAKRPAGLPAATRVVHSWHEVPGERAGLEKRLHQLEERCRAGDVVKVVAWAETYSQSVRAFSLYERTRAPLIAFAQGPGGQASRAFAVVFGAPWIYVRDREQATAPGQWPLSELFALFPPGGAGPSTRLFGVVGNPVGRSRSPLLWNFAFRLRGIDAFYLALEPDRFEDFLAAHGHPAFHGFSVTAPFKRAALQAAGEADAAARRAGAANTLQRTEAGWKAFNTDGPAALDSLQDAGLSLPGRVLILGAGGAARGAAAEALSRGFAVHLAARRAEAAEELAAHLAEAKGPRTPALTAGGLSALNPEKFQAIVNATPVGGDGVEGSLLAGRRLSSSTVALDMVYSPPLTPLLREAREQECRVVPGTRMLVKQMRRQFRIFTGEDVSEEALARAMRAEEARPR
ncbi:MAG: type I 3-dehydroquinate dehydratase [Planctomycetota bacterium]